MSRWDITGKEIMAKEITQIIERETIDGNKEAIIVATDPKTGETSTERAEWYYEGDRAVRLDYAIKEALK
jgi:hypothetical protein